MPDGKKESILDIMSKGATAYIKNKAKSETDKIKFTSALMLEKIKQGPYQNILAQQFRQQQGGGMPGGEGTPMMPMPEYATTPTIKHKGGKFVREMREDKEVYREGLRRKKIHEQGGKIKWDKADEEVLQSLGKKLGLISKEKEPTTAERKILGEVRALKDKNASLEDIQTHIKFRGYEPEDFTEELKEYTPKPRKKFWLW